MTPPEAAVGDAVYGGRGRIGVIDLSTCTSLTAEYQLALPAGVLALFSRLRLPRGEVTVAALDEMVRSERLEEAAAELADAGVDVIAFACTTGSLLHGPGFDREIAGRIEGATGVPATTTATAVLAALDAVGVRRLAVGTPYIDDLNRREKAFLEAAGIEVVAIQGLGLLYDWEIGSLSSQAVRDLALAADTEDAEALFLSCTNLPALSLLPELEQRLGKPVITSNAATIWETLRTLEALPARPGLGRLLSA